jgi:hypothetical protein
MTTPAPTGTEGHKPIRTLYNIHHIATIALRLDATPEDRMVALDRILAMTDRYRDYWRAYE